MSSNQEEANEDDDLGTETPIQDVCPNINTGKFIDSGLPDSTTKGPPKASIELRKLPTDVLLLPSNDFSANFSTSETPQEGAEQVESELTCLRKVCLNPKYTLNTQMMISFGLVNFLTTVFVVVICLLVTIRTGQKVEKAQMNTFQTLTQSSLGITARYLAESLNYRMMPVDIVDVVHEATKDRFLGGLHPSDANVPFLDIVSGDNKYPVIGPELFLDWQVPSTITETNFEEHVQHDRWTLYKTKSKVSTDSGVFVFQGACDPAASPDSQYYLEGCFDANNDVAKGGSHKPSNLTGIVFDKSKDLVPLLKSIFEVNLHVTEIGIYFKAGGSGATVNFPAYPLNGQTNYTSIGCEWMSEPNPFNPAKPIGTREEISQCHDDGENVRTRLYNPMERGWCRDQALNPHKAFVRVELDAWTTNHWALSLGRSIYDPLTDEFLACTYIGISLDSFDGLLKKNRITANSQISVVQFNQLGVVIATSLEASGNSATGEFQTIDQLRIGVTKESYQEFFTFVDYSQHWNATTVRKFYESRYVREHGFVVYAYPIPPVPPEYDSTYHPEFMVFVSISDNDMMHSVRQVNENVNQTVTELKVFASILGVVGLLVTTLMIFAMSKTLTAPLEDMNKAAQEIISNFGSEQKDESAGRLVGSSAGICSPKTELHDLVAEYNKMVTNFSGSSMAKARRSRRVEIKNPFSCRDHFWALYKSRTDKEFAWNMDSTTATGLLSTSPSSLRKNNAPRGPTFVHEGRNTIGSVFSKSILMKTKVRPNTLRSPLFWWTVLLIVLPLLSFTVSISAWVMVRIQHEFDLNVELAKDYFVDVALEALKLHAALRAQTVADSTSSSVRDLYLVTRYFGWLLFGGLERSDSFTKMYSGTDECKGYADHRECPYFQMHAFCHCSWNDAISNENTGDCTHDLSEYPRYRQVPYYLVQSHDALPNGDRNVSSFPQVDDSPQSTGWWDDPLTVPGSTPGIPRDASGYGTLYDRLRVSSAMPLFPVLYNYNKKKKESYGGMFIAFEADGLFLGFRGCPGFEFLHGWKSTVENHGFQLRPELCPLGKYGYDPRCREWYATGRQLASKQADTYITAPYTFADSQNAQSATSALLDPSSGEHVAQVLVNFKANSVFTALDSDHTKLSVNGFPILITVAGSRDENTVIGPGFELNETAQRISHVVLPHDHECRAEHCVRNTQTFQSIEDDMRKGGSGVAKFERTSISGMLETIYIAYAPVTTRSVHPQDSSDFTRGINASEYQIYSLALCETAEGMLEPFVAISNQVDKQVNLAIVIIVTAILVALAMILYVSYLMTISITEPMFYLLDLIRCINKMNVDDERPSTEWIVGPREIISVTATMETLYKVVRAANDAYSDGQIEKAYYVLTDAVRLFKRLGNEKAIGVANNNLGNLMLAMYQKIKEEYSQTAPSCCGLSLGDIIARGMHHFHEAIRLGEKAYDEFYNAEGWTSDCLDFMQHLANRYFNRALFLLSVKNDHESPADIEAQAVRDLEIARDMELEIIAYRKDAGLQRDSELDKVFNNSIVRARGHNMLHDLGYPDELMSAKGYPAEWGLKQRYEEMFEMIIAEKRKDNSRLLEDTTFVGRIQELEGELVRFMLHNGDHLSAARVAIRMIIEDEYAFADSLSVAMDAVRSYVDHTELALSQRVAVKHEIQMYKKEIYRSVIEYLEDGNRTSTESDRSRGEGSNHVMTKSAAVRNAKPFDEKALVLWITEKSSGGFITMEDF